MNSKSENRSKHIRNYGLESCRSYSSHIKLTKTPDFSILSVFIILKKYAIIYSKN